MARHHQGAMMKVTERYSISGRVEFVDVHVERDNRLYVDPSAIRNAAKAADPWAQAAYQSLVDFFEVLLQRIADPAQHDLGRSMLTEFHEPRETRLGMSSSGFNGSGASWELGNRIWDAIVTNPLCLLEVPILRRVEHLPMFVEGIDKDRVSDLTSRIIFTNLVDFTQDQMTKHPTLAAGPRRPFQVWNDVRHTWETDHFSLPNPGASRVEPLLLVPKGAVYYSLRMHARGFWNVPVLGAVQDSEAVVLGNGRVQKPSKRTLRKRQTLQDIRPTNQAWTEREWRLNHEDLLSRYAQYIDEGFDPLDDDEIERRIARR